ncbi:MAG: hypothetical protein A2511_17130 [Deltaproteobacteria bacterium RIFOXYD12_FULL_50_9]|nr:MAG: hypothetical protein A2511_17130 [Deltaproteobacteria bacterium RIFOXYD12_FULL_50_9]
MGKKTIIQDLIRDKRTQLPTLSVVTSNIIKLADDDNASVHALAEFILQDQAIANKVLKLANSAYYGVVKTIASIPHAITIIGFNDVTSLAIGMGVFSAFDLKKVNTLLKMEELWLHSLGCATAAKELATLLKIDDREQIFLNGLLHDMGKIIFALHFPDDFAIALEESKKNDCPLHYKEMEIFSENHATIAGQLMKHWNFPESLILPVQFHHSSAKCPQDFTIKAMIIEVADFLCHKTAIGSSGNPGVADVKIAVKNLGLLKDDLKRIIDFLERQRPKMEEYLQLLA